VVGTAVAAVAAVLLGSCAGLVCFGSVGVALMPGNPIGAEVEEWDARRVAPEFLRQVLVAPATARFSGVEAERVGEDTYLVRGVVDSQNAFGAMVRARWTMVIAKNGSGNWYVKETPILVTSL